MLLAHTNHNGRARFLKTIPASVPTLDNTFHSRGEDAFFWYLEYDSKEFIPNTAALDGITRFFSGGRNPYDFLTAGSKRKTPTLDMSRLAPWIAGWYRCNFPNIYNLHLATAGLCCDRITPDIRNGLHQVPSLRNLEKWDYFASSEAIECILHPIGQWWRDPSPVRI